MIGMMDKGSGTSQMPGQQMPGQQMPPMGAHGNGGLSALFQNLPQVPQTQVPTIAAPQAPGTLMPSPEQAAAATRARMLARNPVVAAAPAAAPKRMTNTDRYGGGHSR